MLSSLYSTSIYFQSRPELAASLGGSSGSNIDVGQAAGRVAAAASAFSNSNSPPPVRRAPSKVISPPAGLVSSKKFGDVDTTSKTSMVVSGLSRKQTPTHSTPIAPSAFGAKKNSFAPPPPHRAEPEPEPEPEEQGEWVEALYDYDSSDPNDLEIRANQRILLIEKTSDDWWQGEVDGKRGLFPAAYVKPL